ncbi:methyltransferase domain-containing protein [Embleya sp. NBC_00896]|uniref:methyltransferase domain-containing protein n=1 Tax=Embleya sp. NBC_00896 TaxID=2975961 RepID=UPI00386C2EF0|nr:methyltransferase domain-containing protein [Embleya sp. NBC_00896]
MAGTARHHLVPAWWERDKNIGDWRQHRGDRDEPAWLAAAYDDRTLVAQVGDLHADTAPDDSTVPGAAPSTSSSTLPSLVLRMFSVAGIEEGMKVLDLGTGSGYSSALLARRLGDTQVVSVDVDPYLVTAAQRRLTAAGLAPKVAAIDALGDIPGHGFDAAVAMFSTRSIPESWLCAVRPGGTISTTLKGTSLHLRVEVEDEAHATGVVVSSEAHFMPARRGPDDGGALDQVYQSARTAHGDETTNLAGDLPDLWKDWQLVLLLELLKPGIEHRSINLDDRSMVWLLHPSGSWARAEVPTSGPSIVHSSGPLDLWGQLERARHLVAEHGPIDPASLRLEINSGSQQIAWSTAGLSLPL